MSKFCSKCGSMCMDEARVCGNCGNILEGPQQSNFSQPHYQQNNFSQPGYSQNISMPGFTPAPAPQKSKKGLIIGIVVAIIAVIIAAVVAVFVFGSDGGASKKNKDEEKELTGSEAALDTFLKAYDEEDRDTMLKIMPDFMYEVFNEGGRDLDDAIDDDIENFYGNLEDKGLYGNLKLSYKITGEEEMSGSELNGFIDAFEYYSDSFDDDKLTDSVKYDVTVTVKCGDEKEVVYLMLNLIKYDGEWSYCGNEWDFDEDYEYYPETTAASYWGTTSYYDYWDDYDYTTSYYDYYDYYY